MNEKITLIAAALQGLCATCNSIATPIDLQQKIAQSAVSIGERAADLAGIKPEKSTVKDDLRNIIIICAQDESDYTSRFDEIAAICKRLLK